MIWIPLATWLTWTPEERGQVSQYYSAKGIKWALDLESHAPAHDRIGEFEEYEGEAGSRGMDHRGFNLKQGSTYLHAKPKT